MQSNDVEKRYGKEEAIGSIKEKKNVDLFAHPQHL